ncbi:MAG: F0F1 ATP synthase subunit B [Candidatus Krumholzibacteriia bacterium]
MLIDWFTVGAQVVNFLVLVWLLKRFLYKPILDALDAREKRIAQELAAADARMDEAQRERDEFQKKNVEFDQQRAALLSQATAEAEAVRQRLLEEARQAATALNAKRQEALRNDARNLNQVIRQRTQQEVLAITRKALADLAGTTLEAQLGEVFRRRLRELDGEAKERLDQAIRTATSPSVVRSAFDLPPDQRAAIQAALNDTFAAEIPLRFEADRDVIGGIEFTANGQKVAWSIAGYAESLEERIAELLQETGRPGEG